jgi:nicotinamide-nucleotide amidase
MIAEIIAIGDELSSGQRLDTNSKWLADRLTELGLTVLYHTTVADDLDANVAVFCRAIERADVVVASGGLGPTADDLTREALARATGVELVLDEASLEHIRGLFARHAREMPARNRLQALFPAGSRPISNPSGTAPGIRLTVPKPGQKACNVFALPGVPAEMFEMFGSSVAPAIWAAQESPQVICHRRIKCFGAGESHLEAMLPDLIRRGREPSVGITVHEATITLRITARGASVQECRAVMEPTLETIRECLGSLVFGEEDDELEDVVASQLDTRKLTLATAEWGTDGLLSQWLARASVQGNAYLGGVTIAAESGLAILDDSSNAQSDARPGLVTRELAAWMAETCRARFASDFGLSVGPFPEAGRGSELDAPAYYFALASAAGTATHSSTLASHPSIWKPRAAKQALNLLRLSLSKTN